MRQYPLLLNDVEVGTVSVHREGMYCRIVCTCTGDCSQDHSVVVKSGDKFIDLGKCSKDSNGYVLRRFVPVKMLGHGQLLFGIGNAREKRKKIMVLDPYEPFPAVALLPYGRFVAEPPDRGIVIEEKNEG